MLHMAMIAFDPIVEIVRAAMHDMRQHRTEGGWITLCLVGRDALGCDPRLTHRPLEKRLGRLRIPTRGEIGIDHLAILINGSVNVRPRAVKADICFVDAPLRAD